MNTGNVFAFADDSLISNTITTVTNSSVSHVGIVVEELKGDFLIIEAARFTKGDYVGAILLSERIKQFSRSSGGKIWELELSEVSKNILAHEEENFRWFLYSQLNKDYDLFGAIGAGIDALDGIGIKNEENSQKMFCSELICFAFKEVGILPKEINSSEVTPIDLCRFNIYQECTQILGEYQEIKDFNSVKI